MKTSKSILIHALLSSIESIFRPSVLWRILIPVLISFVLGILLVGFIWSLFASSALTAWYKQFEIVAWILKFYETTFGHVFFSLVWTLFLIFLFVMIVYILVILLVSIVIIPLLSGTIHRLYFPTLGEKNEISTLAVLWKTLKAFLVYFSVFILCSPLLIIPGMQVILPMILNSVLLRKLLLVEVLQNYASKSEMETILKTKKMDTLFLAILGGGYFLLPVINILAPVFIALNFLFYGFYRLQELRTNSQPPREQL